MRDFLMQVVLDKMQSGISAAWKAKVHLSLVWNKPTDSLSLPGFLESMTTESDEFGLMTSHVSAKRAKPTKKKKGPVKPQLVLVRSSPAMKGLERYFEPRGEMEQEIIKSFKVRCFMLGFFSSSSWGVQPKKERVAKHAGGAPAGNVLVGSRCLLNDSVFWPYVKVPSSR
jgi:hypothetical protein